MLKSIFNRFQKYLDYYASSDNHCLENIDHTISLNLFFFIIFILVNIYVYFFALWVNKNDRFLLTV